jgi:hypothetical protein
MGRLSWLYKDIDFTEEMIGDAYGFVYCITNLTNQKMYIGKKFFYFAKSKQVKGKRKRYKVQSDWQTYYGSNTELKNDVNILGEDNFKREILYLCKTKGECGYLEAKEQFSRKVLEGEEYYNTWIMVRVHKKHVKAFQKNEQD